jgi:hypothetical protein
VVVAALPGLVVVAHLEVAEGAELLLPQAAVHLVVVAVGLHLLAAATVAVGPLAAVVAVE